MKIVQHFERNASGRDFIVGDIHGCFDRLRSALARVRFDESVDRLFSVGDLVDRGGQSIECVDWIAKSWFHAVRGNHEQMAINFANGHNHAFHYERNGGRWLIDLPESKQILIAECLSTLPIAIDIETDDGLVGIVHAEPACGDWQKFCRQLEVSDRAAIEVALWCRDRIGAGSTELVAGVSRVYVGHSPLERPRVLGNVHYIDTGAVFGGPLTLACVSSYALQEAA